MLARRSKARSVELLADRLVERDHAHVGARSLSASGSTSRASARARDQHALARDAVRDELLRKRLGDRARGNEVGRDAAARAAQRPCRARSPQASRPPARERRGPAPASASSSSAAPFGLVRQTRRTRRCQASTASRTASRVGVWHDPDRGRLDDVGAERLERAARPLACARARVTATLRAMQRRTLEPGEPLGSAAARRRPSPPAGRSAPPAATLGDLVERAGDRALAGQRAALDHRGRLSGARPCRSALRSPAEGRARPCRRRASPGNAASAAQSSALSSLSGSSCAVTKATAEAGRGA